MVNLDTVVCVFNCQALFLKVEIWILFDWKKQTFPEIRVDNFHGNFSSSSIKYHFIFA